MSTCAARSVIRARRFIDLYGRAAIALYRAIYSRTVLFMEPAGIAEMSQQPEHVRDSCDKLDAAVRAHAHARTRTLSHARTRTISRPARTRSYRRTRARALPHLQAHLRTHRAT